MSGRLRSSFRRGNLAEDLGILLLKGVAAVAEVARPEDVGVDAVASLLRPADDGNAYAEDTFIVQFKAESATTLEYFGHELKWLLGQTQPMFIGRVSLKEYRIDLYPTLHLNAAVLALCSKKAILRFGRSDSPPFIQGAKSCFWAGDPNEPGTVCVWLGEPLLTWTLADLSNSRWSLSAYAIMKRFLTVVRREQELLSLDQSEPLEWSTNDLESIRTTSKMMKGNPKNLAAVAHRCAPFFSITYDPSAR